MKIGTYEYSRHNFLLLIVVKIISIKIIDSCLIHGTDSGECVYYYSPSFYGGFHDLKAIRKSMERWKQDMPVRRKMRNEFSEKI